MAVLTDEMLMTIDIGAAWDGTAAPSSWGSSSIDLMVTLQDFSFTDTVKKVDVRGAGQKRTRNRFTGAEGILKINKAVRMAGYEMKAMAAGSPIGKWVRVTVKPLTTLSTADTYIGVIEEWETSGTRGDMQLEKFTVTTDVDAGTAA